MFVHAVKRITPVVLLAMALSACATTDPAADETDATTGTSGATLTTSSAATETTPATTGTSGATLTTSSAATETTPATTGTSAATSTTGASSTTSTTGASSTTSTTGASSTTSTTGASSTTTQAEPENFEVAVENFRFVPASITVRVGDTVRWKLESGTHTTTSSTGVWDSDFAGGDRFSFTFGQPGTYAYFCEIHPGMQGTVVVQG
jgi:plastocyanin